MSCSTAPGTVAKLWLPVQECKWQEARVVETLWSLLKEGIAMVDDQGPGGQRLYWFPCLETSGAAQSEFVQ